MDNTVPTRDKWIESARLYIRNESDMCDCDCWLCMNNEHDEHCESMAEEDEYPLQGV